MVRLGVVWGTKTERGQKVLAPLWKNVWLRACPAEINEQYNILFVTNKREKNKRCLDNKSEDNY